MQDLTKMTDLELIDYLEKVQESEYQDYQMDGSGDCHHIITRSYEKIYDSILSELQSRDISLSNEHQDDNILPF